MPLLTDTFLSVRMENRDAVRLASAITRLPVGRLTQLLAFASHRPTTRSPLTRPRPPRRCALVEFRQPSREHALTLSASALQYNVAIKVRLASSSPAIRLLRLTLSLSLSSVRPSRPTRLVLRVSSSFPPTHIFASVLIGHGLLPRVQPQTDGPCRTRRQTGRLSEKLILSLLPSLVAVPQRNCSC